MSNKKKQLEVTHRGITQGQHAAIGGSLVKGLIELITNSNDAYGNSKGEIVISYVGEKLSIIDSAGGIKDVENALKIGSRSADFYKSKGSRGRLGRGLKDVPILAEKKSFTLETIHDKKYTKLIFEDSVSYTEINIKTNATKKDYKSIGCGENGGTKISFKIKNTITRTKFDNLVSKLSDDFELRGIYKSRDVYLSSGTKREKLESDFDTNNYAKLLSKKIEVKGYGDVEFELFRLPEPSKELPGGNIRTAEAGILIMGKNNIFENTLFGFKKRNGAPFFHGTLYAPQIDDLYYEYDENEKNDIEPNKENPIPIIDPSRSGLDRNHPFVNELVNQIENELTDIFDEFDKENDSSSQILDNKSQEEIVRELSKIMKSIFEEDLEVNNEILINDDLELRPFPTNILLNKKKNISVLSDYKNVDIGDEIELTINNRNISFDDSKEMKFGKHRNKDVSNILTAQFSLSGDKIGSSEINISVPKKDLSKNFIVNVKEEEIELIEEFSFLKKSYSTKIDKSKTITLACPSSMVDLSKPIEIELSNNEEFEIINEEKLIMEPIPELDCYGIYIEIKPKSNAGVDSFTNISATMNGYISKCKLKIKKDTLSGIRLVPDFDNNPTNLPERAKVDRSGDEFIITIYLKHQGVREIIPDKKLIDTSESRALLAEIIGEAVLLFRLQEDLYDEEYDIVTFVYNLSTLKGEHMHKFHNIFKVLELNPK